MLLHCVLACCLCACLLQLPWCTAYVANVGIWSEVAPKASNDRDYPSSPCTGTQIDVVLSPRVDQTQGQSQGRNPRIGRRGQYTHYSAAKCVYPVPEPEKTISEIGDLDDPQVQVCNRAGTGLCPTACIPGIGRVGTGQRMGIEFSWDSFCCLHGLGQSCFDAGNHPSYSRATHGSWCFGLGPSAFTLYNTPSYPSVPVVLLLQIPCLLTSPGLWQ